MKKKTNIQYRIRRMDECNIVIDQFHEPTDKAPEGTWRPIAYFHNLEQAALYLLNHNIKGSKAQELLNSIQEAKRIVRNTLLKAVESI